MPLALSASAPKRSCVHFSTEVEGRKLLEPGFHPLYPKVRLVSPLVHCGTADPLGVYDVKDQIGLSTEVNSPGPISRYQPRIPEAA